MGEFRARIFEIGRLIRGRASLTLIAAGLFVAAFGACSNDVAVCEETLFLLGIEMVFRFLFDETLFIEGAVKILGNGDVARPGGAAVVVEGKLELIKKISIDLVEEIDMLLGGSFRKICA